MAWLSFLGRWTCFDMKNIVPQLFLLICTTFLRNVVCKKVTCSKAVLSKLLEVTIHVHVISTSTFIGFTPQDSAWKTEFFCIHYFSKTKRRWTKTIEERRVYFSCPNKSVCQKLARSCKKWKSTQKAIYARFASLQTGSQRGRKIRRAKRVGVRASWLHKWPVACLQATVLHESLQLPRN